MVFSPPFRNLMLPGHTGWSFVKRKVYIIHKLDTTPIEIRTNSTAGSNERVYVLFTDAESAPTGGIDIRFNSKLQYRLPYCHKDYPPYLVDFPTSLPSTTDKVWRVTPFGIVSGKFSKQMFTQNPPKSPKYDKYKLFHVTYVAAGAFFS